MAFIAGLSLRDISESSSTITVPYKWLNRNPFRSTYFAVLSMAAEMSTGLLAMLYVKNSNPRISMLVTSIDGNFTKRALGLTSFRCQDGLALQNVVEQCIITGQSQNLQCLSIGFDESGAEVARFLITWSFKAKI